MEKDIYILSIETSCDETAAAIVKNGREVISNVVASQIDIHTEYGGVVPEIASRAHVELIAPVVEQAIAEAKVTIDEIDAVAVTYGPGLVGALLVGISYAKAFAYAHGKTLIGVHHIEGHIAANYISNPDLKPPYICLVVSGGHSHIVKVDDYNKFTVLGRTRDDAVGEAFDKVARAIGLGYPGGPKVQEAALSGDENAIAFPKVKFHDGTMDFSFSGVKTAVLNYINQCAQKGEAVNNSDIAASFQKAVVDILVENTIKVAVENKFSTIAIAGGVAANTVLRDTMKKVANEKKITVVYPEISLCTDNAAMIASAGYFEYINGVNSPLNLNAKPNLKLE